MAAFRHLWRIRSSACACVLSAGVTAAAGVVEGGNQAHLLWQPMTWVRPELREVVGCVLGALLLFAALMPQYLDRHRGSTPHTHSAPDTAAEQKDESVRVGEGEGPPTAAGGGDGMVERRSDSGSHGGGGGGVAGGNLPLIPYCKPHLTGHEVSNARDVIERGLGSAGRYTDVCTEAVHSYLGKENTERVVMVPSGTAALEMAALLCDIQRGDEVIMPSYTFSSTANAFVLRGAVPVFVDIRWDTLNMDETLLEAAVTERTRAICVVHYAGVACEMDVIMDIAERHGLQVIEDCAQAYLSSYKGRPLGTIGHYGCFSFHYTKNIICGEGGAIAINTSEESARKSLVLWEKGTNRYDFMLGKIDKYHWVDLGSSYIPNELSCAVLAPQLLQAAEITALRVRVYDAYKEGLAPLVEKGAFRTLQTPSNCTANGHIFLLIFPSTHMRDRFGRHLKTEGNVASVAHYVPLHSAPAGLRFGRTVGPMAVTNEAWCRLLRLPIWPDMTDRQVIHVIKACYRAAEAITADTKMASAAQASASAY